MLLGDIHKRQLFNYKQTLCGYSGSLIQQNYGEDILDHGYLLWDLENKKAKEINVYNEIGYINIKEVANDEILIRQNGKYEKKLEDVIIKYVEQFPKNIEIKTLDDKMKVEHFSSIFHKYTSSQIENLLP
jgi:DNA repair exonuclease SbcCD nuclease subunit